MWGDHKIAGQVFWDRIELKSAPRTDRFHYFTCKEYRASGRTCESLIRADQHLGTAHRDLVGRTQRLHDGVALEAGGQVVDQHLAAAIDDHAGTVRDGRIRRGAGVDALAPGGEACNQATQRGGQATDEHVRADRAAGQDRRQDVLDRIGDADGGFAHDQVPLYTSSNSCGKSFAQLSTY